MKSLLALLLLLALTPAYATSMTFKLVTDGGKPVAWGQNSTMYMYQGMTGDTFTTDVPLGSSLLLGRYLLVNNAGAVTSPSPEVKVAGATITVDVTAVDHALRSAGALARWDNALFVAEPYSNDGANQYVYIVKTDGSLGDRFVTDTHPHALAVDAKTLYVAGDHEIDTFDRASRQKTGAFIKDYAADISQMCLFNGKLYVGDRKAALVHVLGVDGAELTTIAGDPADPLKITTGLSGIGVAADGDKLLISDSNGIRMYDPQTSSMRTLVSVHNGSSLAVGPTGDIALAVPSAADPDYGYTPEVWVYAASKTAVTPKLRIVRVYMGGPKPVPEYKLAYFGGLLGKMGGPGGIAFDKDGRLLVSDINSSPKDKDSYFPIYNIMAWDAGIVRVLADGTIDARYGSRYTVPIATTPVAAKEAAAKLPLQHTRDILTRGGKLNILGYGDSITQTGKDWNGGATSTDKNWVHVLGALLQAKYPKATVNVVSDGVGGQNVAEGLSRDPTPRWYVQPDLIMLEFGTNDAAFHHYSPATYAHYLREMITQLRALSSSDILLVSPGPLIGQTVEAPQAEYMKALKQVGVDLNVPVVDIEAAMNAKLAGGVPWETYHLGSTNVHPNDAGHQIWAQAVLDVISPPASTSPVTDPSLLRN